MWHLEIMFTTCLSLSFVFTRVYFLVEEQEILDSEFVKLIPTDSHNQFFDL